MSRRRSTPATKSNVSKNFFTGAGIGLAVFIISLVIVVFGALSAAKNYVRSDKFREMLANVLSENLKAAGQIESVTWQDSSAFTDRLTARGYQDAGFAKLDVAGVRAQLDLSTEHFKRGVWKIPEITVSQLDVVLSENRLPGTYAEANQKSREVEMAAQEGEPNALAALLPKEIEVDTTRISNVNLYWEKGDEKFQATGIQTTITPTSAQNSLRIQSVGGTIQGTGSEKLKIQEVDLNWNLEKNEFYISKADIGFGSDAKLRVEGDIKMGGDDAKGDMLLRANITDLDIRDLVADTWQRRLQGNLKAEATMTGDPNDMESAIQVGTVTLDKGVIEALPVLDLLGTYTKNDRFRRIALRDGGSAEFSRKGSRTEIRNIDLQSDGLAKLSGSLDIEGKDLSGVLQLGIVPGTLRLIPGAERTVFVDSRDGYLWTDINVSGTVSEPTHDLVAQMRDAGIDAAMDFGRGVVSDPMKAKDDAIKMGTDLLKGFFK
tara:strand:- start:871 stop:2340 length:1470 start_codon:yes stop_codon:yes gene_type:complete